MNSGFAPDHDDVVDDHADQVLADRVVLVEGLRDRDLGARRHPCCVASSGLRVVAQRAGIEQSRESADAAEHLGAVRARDGRLHELDRAVAGLGVDAGFGIAVGCGVHRASVSARGAPP